MLELLLVELLVAKRTKTKKKRITRITTRKKVSKIRIRKKKRRTKITIRKKKSKIFRKAIGQIFELKIWPIEDENLDKIQRFELV